VHSMRFHAATSGTRWGRSCPSTPAVRRVFGEHPFIRMANYEALTENAEPLTETPYRRARHVPRAPHITAWPADVRLCTLTLTDIG
jgi:hypothetical protein